MKIIIAIDGSPMSEQLVKTVASRAWPENTQVKILTVLEPFNLPVDQNESAEFLVKAVDQRKAHASKFCEKVRSTLLEQEPELIVHFEVREGSPAAEIVGAAAEWSADKVLIGAHGKGSVTHDLLGSVSNKVVHNSPCSVEVVRPKRAAKAQDKPAELAQVSNTGRQQK